MKSCEVIPHTATRMDRSRLNIGAYILQEYARTEQHVKDIADCGLDFIVCLSMDGEEKKPEGERVLDYFEKYHVGAVISGVFPGWWGGNGGQSGRMHEVNPFDQYEAAVAAYKDHPAVWGIDMGDEPSALDFPYYGKITAYAQASIPESFPYLNLYPNYASVAQNNADETVCQLGTKTYQEHINRYCENVPLDYLCFDYYYFAAGVPRYYENLRITTNACRQTKRSLWIVLQVNSSKEEEWISLNGLRAQAFSSMAFGVENIIWACYTAGWWHHQVLDKQGNKTEQYAKLQAVNAEIHKLAPAYMRYRNAATHFVGFDPQSQDVSALKFTEFKTALDTECFKNVHSVNGTQLVIGEMVARDGGAGRALMICAADDMTDEHNQEIQVSLICDKEVEFVGAEAVSRNGNEWIVKMHSCGGVLVYTK